MERPCRSDVVTPMGLVQRVTTDFFLEHVLPPLPSGLTAKDMLTTIRRYGKKSQRAITRRGRWRGFPTRPASDTRDEESIFAHFAAVIDIISRAGSSGGRALTAKFVQHLVVPTEGFDHATLPNGCIVSASSDKETWEDITALGWYSKFADSMDSFQVSAPTA